MLVAEADYLYGLPQWMDILGEDKIKELTKKLQEIQNCCQGQENRQKRSMPMRQRQKVQTLLR